MKFEKILSKDQNELCELPIRLSPEYPELPYTRRIYMPKRTISWGQRKLLLSEIQFLTLFSNKHDSSKVTLLYVGAAHGIHLPVLHLFFPTIVFHLYDPKPFQIEPTDHLIIYQQHFTDADAQYWKQQKENGPLFFISDIRTADLQVHTLPKLYEELIWKDMVKQEDWVLTIQPHHALLKFRLPYGAGFRDQDASLVTYLDGHLFTQPYAKSASSETRLVPFPHFPRTTWNVFRYENQMYRFNTVDREEKTFTHPLTHRLDPLSGPLSSNELLNDYDSAHEYRILQEYVQKVCKEGLNPDEIHQHVIQLSHLITEALSCNKTLHKLRTFIPSLRVQRSSVSNS